jgi:hypothetical protein
MAFQAEAANYSDLDSIAEIMVDAHVSDNVFVKLMPGVSQKTLVKWYADAFRKVWDEQKWVKYYKVVELETGYVYLRSFPLNVLYKYPSVSKF